MIRRKITLQQPRYLDYSQDFLHYITLLGYSGKTIDHKYANILEFLTYVEGQTIYEIVDIKPSDIKEYYNYLKDRPHRKSEGVLSINTVQQHTHSIRQFFLMLQHKKQIEVNPTSTLSFTRKKNKHKPRIILSIAEIKELYSVTETLLERAILSLAYGCGLRAMEVEAMNIEDIRLSDNILIVQNGKGNKKRVIPMSKKVKEDFLNYASYERTLFLRHEDEQAFLLNNSGERLHKYTCRKILKALLERSGNEAIINKNISIHNLRHSIATHLLEQGVQIEKVRHFLGHSHLETTEIYTRVSEKQLRSLME